MKQLCKTICVMVLVMCLFWAIVISKWFPLPFGFVNYGFIYNSTLLLYYYKNSGSNNPKDN